MKNFFEKPTEKLFDLHLLKKDKLLYYVLPRLLMEIMRKYFRLEVEGVEHLPEQGRCLIVPNHSGFSGFDALVLANEIHRHTGRVPKIMTHHFWFMSEKLAIPAQKMGFYEATTANGLELLGKDQMVTLFPEGEQGNFKPTTKRYQLQEF
ncbi:MAG: 1-acyl-sn-glycerol-3-phosphate acyltransferase, partial [Bdellovibrionales bacterium]|nr:1-acyl-sn-glycerol-3-phosphate acyltransferase [Bdellovibrionales bacterium]